MKIQWTIHINVNRLQRERKKRDHEIHTIAPDKKKKREETTNIGMKSHHQQDKSKNKRSEDIE